MNKKISLILGASKGLGQCIAQECQKNGDTTIEIGSSLQDQIIDDSIQLHCDLADLDSVKNLISKINSLNYPITDFYWAAGRLIKGQFNDHSQEDIIKTIDVNFRNAILIAQYIWTKMQSMNIPCHFVVISSSSGVKARNDEAIYAATKHAQVGFTRSLGLENNNSQLKVSLIMPGGMKTPFWDNNPNPDIDSFLDPKKVAQKILDKVKNQTEKFMELEIPRGSL